MAPRTTRSLGVYFKSSPGSGRRIYYSWRVGLFNWTQPCLDNKHEHCAKCNGVGGVIRLQIFEVKWTRTNQPETLRRLIIISESPQRRTEWISEKVVLDLHGRWSSTRSRIFFAIDEYHSSLQWGSFFTPKHSNYAVVLHALKTILNADAKETKPIQKNKNTDTFKKYW